MDEGTRQGSPPVEEQADKSPEEIRRDIDQTREELGDTVEALAHKTDVKAQARERVDTIKQTAQQKREDFISKARAATPDSAAGGARQVTETAQRNPLPFAIGGALLAGFVIGRITSR
jgi:F0F1-type ATP synthase membrane subunit b/b'